jgi:hypothetical protein
MALLEFLCRAPRGRAPIVLLLALLLAGCSSFGIVYPRMDWVLGWRFDKYADLDAAQKTLRSQEIARFLQWHRSEELPVYARELRQIAAGLDHPVTLQQVEQEGRRVEQLWARVAVQARPGFCRVLRTLDDRQVGQVLERFDKEQREYAEKFVDPPVERRRRDEEKRVAKSIKRWTGSLNARQESAIREWIERPDDLTTFWQQQREAWRGRLAQALQRRDAPDACLAFDALLDWPTAALPLAQRQRVAASEARRYRMYTEVIAAMDATQRRHAQRELLKLAEEMEKLAASSA